MGTRNRQRRAAKVKARERSGRHRPGPSNSTSGHGARPHAPDLDPPPEPSSERQRVEELYAVNQLALENGLKGPAASAVRELARHSPAVVAAHLEAHLAHILPVLWAGGWLPGEVIRQARRATSVAGERVAALAVATDHLSRPRSALHPRWIAHVGQLGLPPGAGAGWLRREHAAQQARRGPHDWAALIGVAAEVAFSLTRLGRLAPIIPPPGSPQATATAKASIIDLASRSGADPVLAKVRQLLAQAESTNFDAEAEAFTAKAQELMSRHAIDAALVWDQQRQEQPITIRVPIDDPYAEPKSFLISVVARESHCVAVIDDRHGLASLVGFETDLVWCETLYTSLLVQAQREMTRAGSLDEAGGHRRSRPFRSSFLHAYASRIGERLAEVNAHVRGAVDEEIHGAESPEPAAAGGTGAGLLPVLARRRSAVDDEVTAQFGQLRYSSARGATDYLGWHAGREAADRADLARGHLHAARS